MATKKTVKAEAEAVKAEVEEKIEAVEATAKKASKTVKKAAAETKTAAKKTVAKATETVAAKKAPAKTVQETYCEINGEQICMEEIVAKVKEAYKSEGHTVASIKSVKTYINISERKAYYVINDNAESKYIEF